MFRSSDDAIILFVDTVHISPLTTAITIARKYEFSKTQCRYHTLTM